MNNKFFKIALLFLWLWLCLSACGERVVRRTDPKDGPTNALQKNFVSDAAWLNTSRPLRPEDLSGRIVLMDFWTFACINCIHIMPDLHRLEQEFGQDLSVIGVHSGKYDNEHDTENIRAAILRYGLEHPIVNDADFKWWNAFGVTGWPTLILFNPNGGIDRIYSGEGHYQELHDDIWRLRDDLSFKRNTGPLPMALEKDKAHASLLSFPGKLTYAPELDLLFVSDSGHHRILALRREGEVVWTIGSGEPGWKDGDFATARFNRPQGLVSQGHLLYVADTENHLLRQVDLDRRQVTTLAGTGKQGFERGPGKAEALTTALSSPWDLAFYPDNAHLAIAMAGLHQLWSYDFGTKRLQVLAGNGLEAIDDGGYPFNALAQPSGLSASGEILYFVDSETSSLRELRGGKVRTLIGTGLFDFGFKDGKQGVARLQHPLGLWADASGIYVADSYNHSLRFFDPVTGLLSTLAGDGKRGVEDGDFAVARFNEPNAVIRVGDLLYVADTNNHAVRILDLAKRQVSTLNLKMASAQNVEPPAAKLPNLKIREQLRLAAGVPIAWELRLPEGWKLNAEAPSRLRLFKISDSHYEPVRVYGKEALQPRSLSLPALDADAKYLLQGTLYYCREGKEALCFLGSAEAEIEASSAEANHEVVWKFGE